MKTDNKTKLGAAISAVMIVALYQQQTIESLPVLRAVDLFFIAIFTIALVYCLAALLFSAYNKKNGNKNNAALK